VNPIVSPPPEQTATPSTGRDTPLSLKLEPK
jgi:hypothetical protein